jgi:hypothetical protein
MNTIEMMTRDCPREDCTLQPGVSTTTCLGWTPSYNRHGGRMDSGNPNITSTQWRCVKCLREWVENEQRGNSTITSTKGPTTLSDEGICGV